MAKKIRFGVIGLGRIGWGFHCHQAAASSKFDLVAVADPVAGRLKEAEETFGCEGHKTAEELLARGDLDAVAIASPTHVHKKQTIAAFRKGLDVILEKPMAMNLTEARAIVRAAKKYNHILTVYQPHRCGAPLQHLLRILATGKIGKVYHIREGRFRYVQRNDWQALTKYGGGMLNNYGAHALDLILAVTGYDVKRVFGQLRRVLSLGDAEDVVKVAYEAADGVLGEVDINQASAIAPHHLQVWGTLGAITFMDGVFHLRYVRGGKLPKKKLNRKLASEGRRYPNDQISFIEKRIPLNRRAAVNFYANFAAAVQSGKELLVKPEETLAVMTVMDRARKDAGKILNT